MSEEDIKALRDLLSNTSAKILTPLDEGYTLSIKRWSRAAEKPAGVSIVPTIAAEAGIALQYVNDNSIDVVVKGGSHSTAGASSTNGSLLIDMRLGMHRVTVDTDKQRLHVQGGAIWGDIDAAAWQHDLATVGGTMADTGVGGLTLGGSYSVLSGQRGLVIDNIVSATVVLANGEVKQASENENADLF